MREEPVAIEVEGGAVPTLVLEPDSPGECPALVVVPSIFGPAPDLVKRLSGIAERALVAVPDPFWRVGGGVVPYDDIATARGRLSDFAPASCIQDMGAVVDWASERPRSSVSTRACRLSRLWFFQWPYALP